MEYLSFYQSKLGPITLASDGSRITGLWFDGQKYDRAGVGKDAKVVMLPGSEQETAATISECKQNKEALLPAGEQRKCAQVITVFEAAVRWLDRYFAGENPEGVVGRPPLALIGTDFQKEVWEILLEIPYGKTTTYGEIARKLAERRGVKTMSAQAVGGAVGHNKISILVPCHRVVGADGKLTGYAGGVERKQWMLEMEQRECGVSDY